MIEYFFTGIVIPIFVGLTINTISNRNKKVKNHQSNADRKGGFTFTLIIKLKRK